MNLYIIFLSLAIFITVTADQSFAASDTENDNPPPRVGLVLSGGGALGLAHVGVLKVLEELHVPVDCVVGTSMGALVGGAYAAGVSPDQMQAVISATDLSALFDDEPPRADIAYIVKRDDHLPLFDFSLGFNDWKVQLPSGASAGYKFELFLKELIGTGASIRNIQFDDLPIPYRAVATDLESGEMKVFANGELSKIMRASMSLPAIIAPTEIDGKIYVDGGLVRNLPVDIARNLCGDILIAVNLGTSTSSRDQIKNSLDVAQQSIVILTEQNVNNSLHQLTADDILITPDLTGFNSSSFSDQQAIFERGATAARANAEALSTLAMSTQDYEQWSNKRQQKKPAPLVITKITADAANAEAVLRDITAKTGNDFDVIELHKDIVDIYGRGEYAYVGYSVEPQDDNATLSIQAKNKPWGPGYLKLGLGAATDFTSPTQLNIAASYRQTQINSLGAVWLTDMQFGYDSFIRTQFLQPLQVRDGAFISPYISVRRDFVQFYQEDIRLGDFKMYTNMLGLDVGITGSTGELRIGPYISGIRGEPDFGIATSFIPGVDLTQSGILLVGIYDQLDRVVFPRSGFFTSMRIKSATEQGTTNDDYLRAQLTMTGVFSLDKNTFSGHLEWGDEISGSNNLPVYESFKLGGPRRLSGLYLDQLNGSEYNLATLSYYRQYASLPPQLGRGMYLGMSLEAGRMNDSLMKDPWDWVSGGSVFWGADTILGSIYLGYGLSSLNQSTWYLVIGPRF